MIERAGCKSSVARRRSGSDRAPALGPERFERAEACLVGHLGTLGDPVAEIDIGQRAAAALIDQRQYQEGAEAPPLLVGIEEAVDGRKPVIEDVDEASAVERAIGAAQLDQ